MASPIKARKKNAAKKWSPERLAKFQASMAEWWERRRREGARNEDIDRARLRQGVQRSGSDE
jgi:hypothetical protein